MSVPGTDFQLLHCTKSRRDPGTADMSDGLSGLNSGAHDPISAINPSAEGAEIPQCSSRSAAAYPAAPSGWYPLSRAQRG